MKAIILTHNAFWPATPRRANPADGVSPPAVSLAPLNYRCGKAVCNIASI